MGLCLSDGLIPHRQGYHGGPLMMVGRAGVFRWKRQGFRFSWYLIMMLLFVFKSFLSNDIITSQFKKVK